MWSIKNRHYCSPLADWTRWFCGKDHHIKIHSEKPWERFKHYHSQRTSLSLIHYEYPTDCKSRWKHCGIYLWFQFMARSVPFFHIQHNLRHHLLFWPSVAPSTNGKRDGDEHGEKLKHILVRSEVWCTSITSIVNLLTLALVHLTNKVSFNVEAWTSVRKVASGDSHNREIQHVAF